MKQTIQSNTVLIDIKKLSFVYPETDAYALRDVSLAITRGEYVAICGANGSGKTTLGRCLIGLCKPPVGTITINGTYDPASEENLFAIRTTIGMVFQSPQDQLVASIVEEEVAFGLENLGIPEEIMEYRITKVLDTLGLAEVRKRPCRFLSAGQQQRLAIASVLAMEPACIIFDEATAMIDPSGRNSILEIMDELNAQGITIVHITHDMQEAARARRVIVMNKGNMVFDGLPDALFALPHLKEWRLCPPFKPSKEKKHAVINNDAANKKITQAPDNAFEFHDVSFNYLKHTVFETKALENISITIPRGSITAFVGATGSGKSTALQLMNLILIPGKGYIKIFETCSNDKKISLRKIRMRCPLVIQIPERALFENFAGDEVAYGPRMQGYKGKALVERVKYAMEKVGLPYELYRDRNPRKLSGGERRKLALASVIAMDADAYLFDEPTASLDPCSAMEIMNLILELAEQGKTIVFATHNMHYADFADTVFCFDRGHATEYLKEQKTCADCVTAGVNTHSVVEFLHEKY
ncbi:MAG TPA: energy-coupling factor transporter ATPase [Spirochaetia bacterium]|nr:energy-coupling factor transporter ATPase [Spirochaetales bacterium]HRS66018.1 energy-coupling factor transporter ATPase [Spirochaetia bacterium]HOT59673.1 energy-coupling factor transporter ATPase [Spirochaetales bacterium]HPD81121.1 energy-coupling factor transporter ATPase [Spirochaetales bacterium]HQK33691.1 energy-coupling factor transporter ATPase [Spirochaetales bacterium]